jgi:hypothetical protein
VLARRRTRVLYIEYLQCGRVDGEGHGEREGEMEIESENVHHLDLTSNSPLSPSPCSVTAAAVKMFAFHPQIPADTYKHSKQHEGACTRREEALEQQSPIAARGPLHQKSRTINIHSASSRSGLGYGKSDRVVCVCRGVPTVPNF